MTKRLARPTVTISAMAIAVLMVATASPAARADDAPIDANPIIRPTTPAAVPQTDAPDLAPPSSTSGADEPKFGAVPLPLPEKAIARLRFDSGDATLNDQAQAALKSFADAFKTESGRATLKAYAGSVGDTSMNARRLSLKRALAVREFLLAQGIDAERLDVMALGGVRDAGQPDRVDIIQAGRQTLGKAAD